MKVCILSTYDTSGGAGRAAYRLHLGLRASGHDSRMIVRFRSSADDRVHPVACPGQRSVEDRLFFSETVQAHAVDANRTDVSDTFFSLPLPGYDVSGADVIREAGVINLHWIARFQSPRSIANLLDLNLPLVWTLHDQGAFTGGCHYSAGCEGFRTDCSPCPQLADDSFAIPAAVLRDKQARYGDRRLTVVCPSRWLADCARKSRIFRHARIEVIPNSLETDLFAPRDRNEAKARLGIASDATTILFCSERLEEKRKGFQLLTLALERCLEHAAFRREVEAGRIALMALGRASDHAPSVPIPTHSLGHVDSDEEIAWIYSAADLFVLPSIEDNLPNTVLEAMSCGTPTVAFAAGGIQDAVIAGVTGLTANAGDANSLARELCRMALEPRLREPMASACREIALARFALTTQAESYAALFEELSRAPAASSPRAISTARPTPGSIPAQLASESEHELQFGNLYNQLLLAALKDLALRLTGELETSEADRAARLEAIHKYQVLLEENNADREERLKAIKFYQTQLQVTQAVMAQQIKALNGQIEHLMSTEQSLRNLIRNMMRRFGLLEFIRHHSKITNWIYLMALRAVGVLLPGRAARRPAAAALLDAPLVEGLIRARGMTGGLDERTLVALFELGSGLGGVLCLNPTPASIQALYMVSRGGAVASAIVADARTAGRLVSFGIIPIPESFDKWASMLQPGALLGYNLLILDPTLAPESLEGIRGYLCGHHRLLITGCASSEAYPFTLLEAKGRAIDGVFIVDAPPSGWLEGGGRETHGVDIVDRKPLFGDTMPSGRPWPKISVVTVTLNQGAFLEQTLRSVLDQGYPNLEYIAIDGGSTDNTADILERYRDRLAVFISEKDNGQSDALNKGFGWATGDIMAWLNSDDRYMPDTFFQVAMAFDNFEADMVAGGCALVRDAEVEPFDTHHNSLPFGESVALPLDRLLDIDGSWQKGDFFYQPEVFWRRDIWLKAGGSVDDGLYYSMDYDLWVRMARHGARIVHIPQTLAIFRFHSNQKTVGADLPFLDELRRVNAEFLTGKR